MPPRRRNGSYSREERSGGIPARRYAVELTSTRERGRTKRTTPAKCVRSVAVWPKSADFAISQLCLQNRRILFEQPRRGRLLNERNAQLQRNVAAASPRGRNPPILLFCFYTKIIFYRCANQILYGTQTMQNTTKD